VNARGLRASRVEPVTIVRAYVLVLGAGLLLEGGGLLLFDRLGVSVGIATSDARHNVLHVIWGVALLAISVTSWRRHAQRVIWAALVFGAFYVALGILGLTLDRPFGLQLGPGENVFHFTVGPLALLLGVWALKSTHDRAAERAVLLPTRLAATVPLRRRRPSAERKRSPRRGRSRRR
jgi:hypothetical protein